MNYAQQMDASMNRLNSRLNHRGWPSKPKEKQKVFSSPLFRSFVLDSGYTSSQLAKLTGVRPCAVQRWMRGMNAPAEKQKEAVAQALGLIADDFMVEVDYE